MNTPLRLVRPALPMWVRRLTLAAALLAAVGLLGLGTRPVQADPRDGQQLEQNTVLSGTDDIYYIAYNGGEQGDIHVLPDNPDDAAALEIKVYDPDGNLVTRCFGLTDPDLHCSFDVDSMWAWRTYTIKVVNFSDHDIDYTVDFY